MNKQEFLDALRSQLDWLSDSEKQKTEQFYSEMIDDRMEDGMSEQEAVESLGSIDDIIEEIKKNMSDQPAAPAQTQADTAEKSSGKAPWVVLAICGFPVWLPLAIAAFSILFAIYISILAVTASLFVATVCLAVAAFAAVLCGIIACFTVGFAPGLALIGSGIAIAGLFIMLVKPMWWVCRETVMLIPKLSKKLFKRNRSDAE